MKLFLQNPINFSEINIQLAFTQPFKFHRICIIDGIYGKRWPKRKKMDLLSQYFSFFFDLVLVFCYVSFLTLLYVYNVVIGCFAFVWNTFCIGFFRYPCRHALKLRFLQKKKFKKLVKNGLTYAEESKINNLQAECINQYQTIGWQCLKVRKFKAKNELLRSCTQSLEWSMWNQLKGMTLGTTVKIIIVQN